MGRQGPDLYRPRSRGYGHGPQCHHHRVGQWPMGGRVDVWVWLFGDGRWSAGRVGDAVAWIREVRWAKKRQAAFGSRSQTPVWERLFPKLPFPAAAKPEFRTP